MDLEEDSTLYLIIWS